MGLLDSFLTMDPQTKRGLLDFGLNMLAQGNAPTGVALGRSGLLTGQLRQQREDNEQMGLFRKAQFDELTAQREQRRQAAEAAKFKAQRDADFMGALGTMSPARAASLPGGPTAANAMQIGAAPNWQAMAMQFPEQAAKIKELAEAGNWGRSEVARTIEEDDARGGKQTVQFDKYGQRVGAAVPGYIAPIHVNQGDRMTFVRPQAGMSLPIGMSPAERDASARGWANVKIARDNAQRDALPKPPPGYRHKADGSMEAIPGGPADIKAGEAGAKADARRENAISGANSVLGTIGEAKSLVGYTTAGFGGLVAPVPTSDARNLRAKLDTIKANIGFDRLQQMREVSPTGGALGQVAVQELQSLQATIASLDQMQSPQQLSDALDKVERHYTRWLETVQSQRRGAGGSWADPAGAADATQPAPGLRRFNPATGRIE